MGRTRRGVLQGVQRLERDAFCGGQVIPGLLKYGDIPEVGSLIAPRPAVWETGDADPGMPPQGKAEIRRRVQMAYDAAGQPNAVSFYSFKGGHVWNGTTGVPLLNKVLKSR